MRIVSSENKEVVVSFNKKEFLLFQVIIFVFRKLNRYFDLFELGDFHLDDYNRVQHNAISLLKGDDNVR